jgi:hypothetical protein
MLPMSKEQNPCTFHYINKEILKIAQNLRTGITATDDAGKLAELVPDVRVQQSINDNDKRALLDIAGTWKAEDTFARYTMRHDVEFAKSFAYDGIVDGLCSNDIRRYADLRAYSDPSQSKCYIRSDNRQNLINWSTEPCHSGVITFSFDRLIALGVAENDVEAASYYECVFRIIKVIFKVSEGFIICRGQRHWEIDVLLPKVNRPRECVRSTFFPVSTLNRATLENYSSEVINNAKDCAVRAEIKNVSYSIEPDGMLGKL